MGADAARHFLARPAESDRLADGAKGHAFRVVLPCDPRRSRPGAMPVMAATAISHDRRVRQRRCSPRWRLRFSCQTAAGEDGDAADALGNTRNGPMLRITCPGCHVKRQGKTHRPDAPMPGCDVLIRLRRRQADAPAADQVQADNAARDTPVVRSASRDGRARKGGVGRRASCWRPPNKYLICDRQRSSRSGRRRRLATQDAERLIALPQREHPRARLIELRIAHGADSMYVSGIVCHELLPLGLPIIARGQSDPTRLALGHHAQADDPATSRTRSCRRSGAKRPGGVPFQRGHPRESSARGQLPPGSLEAR